MLRKRRKEELLTFFEKKVRPKNLNFQHTLFCLSKFFQSSNFLAEEFGGVEGKTIITKRFNMSPLIVDLIKRCAAAQAKGKAKKFLILNKGDRAK